MKKVKTGYAVKKPVKDTNPRPVRTSRSNVRVGTKKK